MERVQQVLLQRYGQTPGWRLVRPSNLHLTLHFIGSVESGQKLRIEGLLRAISWPPAFTLSLFSQVQGFPSDEAALVQVMTGTVPAPLAQLHRSLGEGLEGLGIPVDQRPYVPHITLSRSKSPVAIKGNSVNSNICMKIDRFVLFASERDSTGPYYRPLEEFTLEAGP